MNKLIFSILVLVIMPLSGMNNNSNNDKFNAYDQMMTEQDAQEEFCFWQFKKIIKILPKLNAKLSNIEKEHIYDDLCIPPHTMDQNYPIDARENSFESHLFTNLGKIAEQRFQRKDLNALKEKIEPLLIECDNECMKQCGRPHEASVEQIQLAGQIILDKYRDQILEILKDIKKPYPYRHAFKPFNLLAFNLKKDKELNDYLDSLKEKYTKQEERQPLTLNEYIAQLKKNNPALEVKEKLNDNGSKNITVYAVKTPTYKEIPLKIKNSFF